MHLGVFLLKRVFAGRVCEFNRTFFFKMEDKTSHFYVDVNDLVDRVIDHIGKGKVVKLCP